MFRCAPVGSDPHKFSVVLTAGGAMPVWSPPPPCPEHPDGHVVRDGRYGSSSAKRRQRYRCYPDVSNRQDYHRFTPVLPRDHVHTGEDQCDDCEELRGTHRGDQAVSRRQSWSAQVVAEALRDLSRGATYAEVSKRSREMTHRTRTRAGRTGRDGPKNWWHIAADWTEVYGPVLWSHVEEELCRQAEVAVAERDELRAAGKDNPAPLAIVIDDKPVAAKWVDASRKRSSRDIFAVLSVAELSWHSRGGEIDRQHRLRLARAYATSDHIAWKLVFDELGYVPDYIITDADDSQLKAVREFYAGEAHPPVVIPSMFHIRNGVELALFETAGTFTQQVSGGIRELHPELADHIALLSRRHLAKTSAADWTQWWDDLEGALIARSLPVERVRLRRGRYEQEVAAILPTIAKLPHLPLSTGGVEVAIRQKIEPLLDNRGHAFANLERTNRLFDLVVCDAHGLFHDLPHVIGLLRADSAEHDGWSSPLRAVADPQPADATAWTGRYSSLRDQLLVRELARAKGLS